MPSALELHGIAKLYGMTAALKAIDLRLEPAQTLALLGPNGSGKTTLLKILAGTVVPTMGHGTVWGHQLGDRSGLRSDVGLLAAESYLYDDLTARENLQFVATMAGMRGAGGGAMAALQAVDLVVHTDARVRSFSSGMKRRLSVARLMMLHPHLLLLDEPYNSLDAAGADLVDVLMRREVAKGHAVVLATHDADRALALADQVAVLARGRLVYSGPVSEYRVRDTEYVG